MKYASDHILTSDIVRRQTRSLHRHFAEQCRNEHGVERRVGNATWIQVHPQLPVRAWLSEPDLIAEPGIVDSLLSDVRAVRPGAEVRWLLYRPPDQPAVRDRLEELGFELRVDCPGMTCAPGDMRSAAAGALVVTEVANSRDARVWTSIYTQSNGHPQSVADAFGQALPQAWEARTDSRWFLGYEGDRPVSCAKLRIEPDPTERVAGIYQLATLPEFRGKGYGATLMQRVMEYARDTFGVDTFVLQAEPEAKRLYERLGFRADSIMAVHILNG